MLVPMDKQHRVTGCNTSARGQFHTRILEDLPLRSQTCVVQWCSSLRVLG